ncbi:MULTISPECIES: hypothetical protein [Streptomyces]|uniref:hypothetical protein n=1 Tax=Streptomyces TaxID=1883 RepID=UPI001C54C5B3|nr:MULTISPECIES: hypothetical protein [unclassified Streptomyces]WTE31006.1 hypothetical protein OHB50_37705 [Streptomyces anulatus]
MQVITSVRVSSWRFPSRSVIRSGAIPALPMEMQIAPRLGAPVRVGDDHRDVRTGAGDQCIAQGAGRSRR